MNDQLMKDVKAIVDEIFKEKEDADMRRETEEALRRSAETITQLNESLEAKDEEHAADIESLKDQISALEAKLEELEASKTNLEEEKAAFDAEKDELTKRAEEAEGALENIRKDQLAKARIDELTEAGVASTNAEAQLTKVREMSDEDFAAYKDELVSVRESIVAQLKASEEAVQGSDEESTEETAEEESTEEESEEEASEEESEETAEEESTEEESEEEASEEESEEEASEEDSDEEVAVSARDAIDKALAATAAMNMEATPSDDIINKYKALGAAMAKSIQDRR